MTKLEFKDIRDESLRVYVFPNEEIVELIAPLKLNVSASGGHRVLTEDGISHYIPPGWIHLYWEVKPGRKAFAF